MALNKTMHMKCENYQKYASYYNKSCKLEKFNEKSPLHKHLLNLKALQLMNLAIQEANSFPWLISKCQVVQNFPSNIEKLVPS